MTDLLLLFWKCKFNRAATALFWYIMKIRYLGTGAAEGIPAMFCNCDFCRKVRELGESEFHTRSQVILDDAICIDFPPDAYAHSLRFGVDLSALKYLLVTHSHMDHFYAHDFILRGYKYAEIAEPIMEIYGNSAVRSVFCECTARELKPEVAANYKFTEVKPFEEFAVGDYRVVAIPANHGKTEDALLYYIERGGNGYLHCYDTGRVSDEALDYLKEKGARVGLISFDCTFVENSGAEATRHMGIPDNMLMKQKLIERGIADSSTKIVITHFSHNGKPYRSVLKKLEEQYGVIAAYDGLEVVF